MAQATDQSKLPAHARKTYRASAATRNGNCLVCGRGVSSLAYIKQNLRTHMARLGGWRLRRAVSRVGSQ